MELCMEARALKSSLRGELAAKSTVHVLPDDHRSVAGAFSAPADDFSVDDLLDLSSGEFEVEDEDKNMVSIDEDGNSNIGNLSASGDSDSFLSDELAVPEDEVAGLEWVSQFVYDSSPEWSLLYSFGGAGYGVDSMHNCQKTRTDYRFTPGSIKISNFHWSVPVKARTKRQRTNRRVWSLWPASSLMTSLPAPLNFGEPVHGYWAKRLKKESAVQNGWKRCMHCLVQRTPQWRTGPDGPKTLCNACGVRFKTGRLLPEYRPVSSPTFSRDFHSNSHRKVMEMRTRRTFR